MAKRKLSTAQIAAMVAIATLGSKVIGFVREMVLANYFGAGMVVDAYVMGQSIPNTLMAALVTAVGTAYMPILAQKFEKESLDSANRFTSQLLNFMVVVISVVYGLSIIFSGQLVSLFAPGYVGEKAELTAFYMRIAFIALYFNVGVTTLEAYLQYKGTFVPQTFIGYLQSISIIVFILLGAKVNYKLIIFGVVIGFFSRAFCDWLLAKSKGFKYSLDFQLSSAVKEVAGLAIPVFIGGSFSEINTFVDKMLASGLTEGSVSALNYGSTMISVIISFIITIMMTIVYPKLNAAFATNDLDRVSSLSERGINLLSIISIPFALGAMLYSKEIITIIYERGAFDKTATAMAAVAFMFYAIRIPFYGISTLITKVFYALHDTKIAAWCSAIAMVVNIVFNLILVKIWGLAGLAIATSFAEFVGMITRYIIFGKKYKDITLLKSKKKLLLTILFSVAAVAISYLVYVLCAGISILLIRLVLAVLAAAIAYLVMLYIAKFEELNLIKDLFYS